MIETINEGDHLSEMSHYTVKRKTNSQTAILYHFESDSDVEVSLNYLANAMRSSDCYKFEEEVTKEDTPGKLGIRSLFEQIPAGEVFTVCFRKQAVSKTKKAYKQEVETFLTGFAAKIEKAKAQKKSVRKVVEEGVESLVFTPLAPVQEGDLRVLRGYKVVSHTRDGKYVCMDMDKLANRLVNINTIVYLIHNNVKYTVK